MCRIEEIGEEVYIAWGQMDSRGVGRVVCHFSKAGEAKKARVIAAHIILESQSVVVGMAKSYCNREKNPRGIPTGSLDIAAN